MKYKIIVDKQPMTSPSLEKKEYEIDIEELRCKGSVADSIVFTKEETYVMRRLSLSEYHVLSVLPEPVKEVLENVNIDLFQGDNYIYIMDMIGNKFYAEYILDNDFNKTFATKIEMFATIETLANSINIELQKKVDGEDYTSAQILLKINNDESEAKISADKIELLASSVLNVLANNEINLKSKNITIISDILDINQNGITLIDNDESSLYKVIQVKNQEGTKDVIIKPHWITMRDRESDGTNQLYNNEGLGRISTKVSNYEIVHTANNNDGYARTQWKDGDNTTTVSSNSIETPKLTQTSLKSKKKNIKKLKVNALELVKQADICEYNLKQEKAGTKKHIGLVIGQGYNCPEQVIDKNGQGVEQYSLTSLLWKAVQELAEEVERLEEKNK